MPTLIANDECIATTNAILDADLDARPTPGKSLGITAEVLEQSDALKSFEQELTDLAARAVSKNILQELPLLRASWRHLFSKSRKPRVILCWNQPQTGSTRKLIGVFPVTVDVRFVPIRTVLSSFDDPLRFMETPLVDPDHSVDAFSTYLNMAKKISSFPHACRFRRLHITGAIETALEEAAAQTGWIFTVLNRHKRAALNAQRSWNEVYRSSIRKKKRKDYERLRRRLEEKGRLKFEVISNPEEISDALDRFLDLEAAGWKGRKETNILSRSSWTNFIRDFVPRLAQEEKCEIVFLTLDGRSIASGILLISNGNAWFYKTAFDESYAAYSPGVLLTLDLTRYLCDRIDISFADSCAPANHPMINQIWRERIEIANYLTFPSSVPFARLILGAVQLRHDMRHGLKPIYLKSKSAIAKFVKLGRHIGSKFILRNI